MIKFVRQKSREHSVKASKSFFKKKGESNDSGTESDGEVLDGDKHRPLDLDMETSLSSCADANSPTTDTACSSSASSAMMCQSHLLYDQHSSEEELEVINGPSSVAAAEAASNVMTVVRGTTSSLISERGSSSLEPEELFGEPSTSKRSSSTLIENRKRSLAHSSDDDQLRNFLEPVLTPVNFRTSPPLEAFKPNRSHKYRSTTPLILSEARCGIENMKLCDNSVNDDDDEDAINAAAAAAANDDANGVAGGGAASFASGGGGSSSAGACCGGSDANNSTSVIKACASSLKMSNSSHHIYQPQPKYNFQYSSSRSSPASTTGLDAMEVRSVSPPAKLFHSARSPHRRPIRTQHATQRLQRPHRPCLDFDKMQQVSL